MRNGIDAINYRLAIQEIPFLAIPPDRIFNGLIPVYEVNEKGKIRLKTEKPENQRIKVEPLFYSLPEKESTDQPQNGFTGKRIDSIPNFFLSPMVVPLYEFKDQNGFYSYSVKSTQEGLIRTEKPVCRVWINPTSNLNYDFDAKPVPIEIGR